ncbi:MAG: glycosyltransferase family 2 protein [Woeseiaceae bacterium]
MIIEFLFWLLSATIVYVYAGYPLLLAAIVKVSGRREVVVPPETPLSVTLVISAFNEADCIAAKLENTLALDYPKEHLDILVISDASDDGTDEIVNGFTERGVRLIRMEDRGGKTVGLNAAVENSESDIVVFSDANAMYRPDAVTRLTDRFSDEKVGAVIGESTYTPPETDSGRAETAYWDYEIWIKALESQLGSVVGGDGAIYAVRRSLYIPLHPEALSDFVNPLQVVKAGFRCVYEPTAISYEEAAEDFHKEYRRKVRIVNRAWNAMLSLKEMLNPFRFGWFSAKLWSHKVLRWWVPAMMVGALVTNCFLLDRSHIYWVTLIGQLSFYTLAFVGYLKRGDEQPVWLRIPYYFCLVNFAAAVGIFEAMTGKKYKIWTTARLGDN